jgi:hypothetical protein
MKWLRRVSAVPLLVLALLCLIGSLRMFRDELPDSITGSAVFGVIPPA